MGKPFLYIEDEYERNTKTTKHKRKWGLAIHWIDLSGSVRWVRSIASLFFIKLGEAIKETNDKLAEERKGKKQ